MLSDTRNARIFPEELNCLHPENLGLLFHYLINSPLTVLADAYCRLIGTSSLTAFDRPDISS
jgi:hypothetical protein